MGEKFAQWITATATLSVAVTFFAVSWHFLQDLSYIQHEQQNVWISRMIGMVVILIVTYLPYYFVLKIIKRMSMPYFGHGAVVALIICDITARFLILINNHMFEMGSLIFVVLSIVAVFIVWVVYVVDRCIACIKTLKNKEAFICAYIAFLIDPRSDRR